jgi:hypothetical protein
LLKREEEGGGLAMETRAQLAGVGSAVGALPPLRVSRLPKLPQSGGGGAKLEWNDDQTSARWVMDTEAVAETGTRTETLTITAEPEPEPVLAAVPAPAPDKLQWSADGTSACWNLDAVPVEAVAVEPEAIPVPVPVPVPEEPVREVQYHLSFQSKVRPMRCCSSNKYCYHIEF